MKPMSKRNVEQALADQRCSKLRDRGDHEVWGCPCGKHQTAIPRQRTITAGVVRTIIRHLACLPEGWLQ